MRALWLPGDKNAILYPRWAVISRECGPCTCCSMYQTMEIYMARKKKVQDRVLPNTYRIFNEHLFDVGLDQSKSFPPVLYKKPDHPPPHPRSPNRNNMPHPYHARFLRDNVRFLNEPVTYMLTSNTKHKQAEWWPSHEENVKILKPAYDLTTTQRSDFGHMTYSSPQTRHGCNPHKSRVHGIVPIASPRGRNRLPKLLQEEISFLHQYDSRLTPNEPIRGKRHGAFVWREIKTESGSAVPQGTRLFLNATGSHALNSDKQKEETQWKAA